MQERQPPTAIDFRLLVLLAAVLATAALLPAAVCQQHGAETQQPSFTAAVNTAYRFKFRELFV